MTGKTKKSPASPRKAATSAQLVVVGSSAGGIEALSTLVSTLPVPFPAPIVIAQHLGPDRPSHLGEILARRTALPVITVHQHEPLHPNTIYVVPANHHIEVTDHDITLMTESDGRPRPSVDLLLSSAAEIYGDRLIAVILTGTGTDGAIGSRAVHQAGGTIIIQNPSTAAFPGMPLALEPQTIDIVADLPRIGPILYDLLTGVAVPTQADAQRELEPFLDMVREHTGLDFRTYKTPTILRRLQRRIIALGTHDLAGYTSYLQQHPEEYQRLTSAFLIKVTNFMRDQDLFDVLRETILPGLMADSRNRDNNLRFWSAGCATGEEAYSLAILVLEALGDDLPDFNVKIFATDVDGEAIAFARHGLYPQDALDDMPNDLVARYFTRVGHSYEVKKQVRSLIVFGEHDLGQRAPFPHLDMVMCRNVLIYFTRELQQRALQIFAFSLREGGYLALGKTETVSPASTFFVPYLPKYKIYSRHGKEVPVASFLTQIYTPPHTLPRPHAANRQPSTMLQELFQTQKETLQARISKESLLLNLPVGVVVVDRRYDIQEINNAARRLLGIYTVAIGEDLVHLAQNVPNKAFRTAIDKAFRDKRPEKLDDVVVPHMVSGEPTYLQIQCYPQPNGREGNEDELVESVLILISDVTGMAQARRELEQAGARALEQTEELARSVADLRNANNSLAASNEQTHQANVALAGARQKAEEEALRHVRQMEKLAEANRDLLAANQELTVLNGELRSRLDDFVVTNEEAQAAIEEVETLNEEMQAANEELETLNEELQATVEELNTSNSDLMARGDDLQNLAASNEAQQQAAERKKTQLEAILAGLADAVLVVNKQDQTLLSNETYKRLFGGSAAGAGKGRSAALTDEHGRPLPPGETPQARAARGEKFSMTFNMVSPSGEEERWLEAIGKPVPGEDGEEWGVVVIRDITERSLRLMQEEFTALASHELRTPLTAIKGYLQMIAKSLKEQKGSERNLHHAEIALTQVNRQMRLIEDLLDAARIQNGKFRVQLEPVRLDALLEQTMETAQVLVNGKKVGLTADKEDGDGPAVVNADAMRLSQAVLNLITNAATHAPDSARIDVRLRRADGMAEIQVQDYGKGIAAKDLPNLFRRFSQVGQSTPVPGQGMGLGLFIARQTVQAHSGTISVESVEGEGATFTIKLPLLEQSG